MKRYIYIAAGFLGGGLLLSAGAAYWTGWWPAVRAVFGVGILLFVPGYFWSVAFIPSYVEPVLRLSVSFFLGFIITPLLVYFVSPKGEMVSLSIILIVSSAVTVLGVVAAYYRRMMYRASISRVTKIRQ